MSDKMTFINLVSPAAENMTLSKEMVNHFLDSLQKKSKINFKIIQDKRIHKFLLWPDFGKYTTEQIMLYKVIEREFIYNYNFLIMGNENEVKESVQRSRIANLERILDYVPFVLLPTEVNVTLRSIGETASIPALIEDFANKNHIIMHYENPFDLRSSRRAFINNARDYYITRGDLSRFTNKSKSNLKMLDIVDIFCGVIR